MQDIAISVHICLNVCTWDISNFKNCPNVTKFQLHVAISVAWYFSGDAAIRYVRLLPFLWMTSCLQIMTGYSKMVHASRDSPEGSTGAKSDVYVIISSLCLPVGFHFSRKRRDFPHERNFYLVGTPALARLNFAWWKLSEALSQCRMWITGIYWGRASWAGRWAVPDTTWADEWLTPQADDDARATAQ